MHLDQIKACLIITNPHRFTVLVTNHRKCKPSAHLQGTQDPPQAFVVLIGERREDRHGVLCGLTLWAHVLIDVVGLALQDSHTASVVPVLTSITTDVKPAKIN